MGTNKVALLVRLYLQEQLEHETVCQYWFTYFPLMMLYLISLSLSSNTPSKDPYHPYLGLALFLGYHADLQGVKLHMNIMGFHSSETVQYWFRFSVDSSRIWVYKVACKIQINQDWWGSGPPTARSSAEECLAQACSASGTDSIHFSFSGLPQTCCAAITRIDFSSLAQGFELCKHIPGPYL